MSSLGNEKKTTAPVLLDKRLLPQRFLLVSNRLPYQIDLDEDGTTLKRGVGGLVTALEPIMQHTGGTWIGWSGNYETVPKRIQVGTQAGETQEYNLRPIPLSRKEVEDYYLGYSNKSLWPLFHYFQEHCEFNRDRWRVYQDVNRRFAEAVVEEYSDGDLIWVHDYHLMLVPAMLREALPDAKIGFFLHIPFPDVEVFLIEPQAKVLIEGLLGADLIGFHVDSYANKFLDAVSRLTDYRYSRSEKKIGMSERVIALGSFPISIDFDYFVTLASREETAKEVKAIRDYYHADVIALGVDRLDYTKGILERLKAIEIMLERHPDVQGRFTFVQVSAPSRTKVRTYRQMREQIEMTVGRVNGRFSGSGCLPIDYRYESLPQTQLAALYRATDLALVTPLRDGMNLIAKEYVASQLDETGALLLSRFTGAFSELKDAFVVNPYDREAMAEKIYQVIRTPEDEKRKRMQKLRNVVRRNDIYWWLERFLRELH
jgi:alpha,alpha-trehalose-phosphate synthase [UDP-forming]